LIVTSLSLPSDVTIILAINAAFLTHFNSGSAHVKILKNTDVDIVILFSLVHGVALTLARSFAGGHLVFCVSDFHSHSLAAGARIVYTNDVCKFQYDVGCHQGFC